MNEFARWSINTHSVAILLGFVVLWLSLHPSKERVIVMAFCYAVISIALGWPSIFRQIFEIRMVNAFGGSPVPLLAYLIPLLEAAFFLVPICGLFGSASASRRIGFIAFGVILPLMLGVEIIALYIGSEQGGRVTAFRRQDGVFSIPHGLTALGLTALWLRIHSCMFMHGRSNQSLQPTAGRPDV